MQSRMQMSKNVNNDVSMNPPYIERIHSRVQHPCKFTRTKESAYIRKELNSHRIGLVQQHGRRLTDLGHGRIIIMR